MDDGSTTLDFWAIVGLASAIATALATGVATLAALWWRWQDRTTADWAWYEGRALWSPNASTRHGEDPRPHGWATIANAGDGVAFRVEVTGEGCTAALSEWTGSSRRRIHVLPAARPGDEAQLDFAVEDIKDWGAAAVVIEWTRAPTWKGRRDKVRIPLPDMVSAPKPQK